MNRSNSLDQIEVAAPCTASWDEMSGDQRIRFCGQCKLNVYNISDMGQADAEALITQREGRMCVRFYRRTDGTVLTRDCPVGVRALKQRFVRAVTAIASVLVTLISGTVFGGFFQRYLPASMQIPSQTFTRWIDPTPVAITGVLAWPPPPLLPSRLSIIDDTALCDPAETPLLAPTPAQLEQVQQRLEK